MSYAVTFRKRFKLAVIALLLPMFLSPRGHPVFCAGERKNHTQKEEEYRSAEGRILI
jgi:hypothetical protein